MAANRDDAAAKVCEQGAGNLLSELSGFYAKNGRWEPIERVSSAKTGVALSPGSGKNGIEEADGTVLAAGGSLHYVCNGEEIVTFTPVARSYTDSVGVKHDEMHLDVIDPASATTIPAKIAGTDFNNRDFFKSNPGYVIGGN
ncbi:hypothetical protein MNB_SV-8-652 [hydrothermal vent metagenome]|uniref:Uncharacterized protein n=1 Tax=hydrothermal vent metagenome TaxID=652676 RepID=A0A1W1BMZ9_9ZZZZ